MKQFINVVREIRGTLTGIIIFFILLNSLLIFLGVYLVLALFDLYPLSALIPSIFYLMFTFYRESKVNKVKLVERYYPQLREKLRTAADYAGAQNNPVVDELHQEVMAEMNKVAVSSFFNQRETLLKISVIILLCFAIVSVTTYGVSFAGLKFKFIDKINQITGEPGDGSEFNPLGDAMGGKGNVDDIYGKRSIARLGKEDLEIELKPSSYEFAITASTQQSEEEGFTEQFPQEVISKESENYRDNTPKQRDDQDIVKRYFRNLAEVEG